MNCPRCGKQNEQEARFCTKCGLNFLEYQAKQAAPSTDSEFCYRHPKVATNLACGRCNNPVCTDCVIIGPAGPRCPDCAKSTTPFRPAAIGLEAKRVARSVTSRGPFAWYYIIIIIVVLGGFLRGCTSMFTPQPTVIIQPSQEEDN
ncbi:hypothetical protein C0431_10605 [bacterium]|jgi:hypothetical protein|nr:hypothetical protein [bacterium]